MSNLREVQLGKTGIQFIDGDRSKRYPKREEFVDCGVLFLNAASINTLDENGFPQSRIILIKEITNQGPVFFTNYLSAKGKEIEKHAILLSWLKCY